MNRLNYLKKATAVCFVALGFTWLVPSGTVKAVNPPPDGGYPNNNTAEGQQALFSLTTGSSNTALGFRALFRNEAAAFNTAVGSQALENTTTGGGANTGIGIQALFFNTTGDDNVAVGGGALRESTTASFNTAVGEAALLSDQTGNENTATGKDALRSNTVGSGNTANGIRALHFNRTGERNTAIGFNSLKNNTTGSFNVALGVGAGSGVITADDVICIGQGVAGADVGGTCFIGNIRGVQTQNANALPVVIDGAGQLGTVASSERFKKDIAIMGQASEGILSLRPVTFHYKTDTTGTPQFGLIAEEVAKVNPALVVPDKDGKPFTVRYDAVNAMLLNEFLKEHRKVQELEAALSAVNQRLLEQDAEIRKVRAEIELSKSAPQTVLNDR